MLTRWTDGAQSGPEARAAQLFRRAREMRIPQPPPLSLVTTAPRRPWRRSRRLVVLLLPFGAIAALLTPRLAVRAPSPVGPSSEMRAGLAPTPEVEPSAAPPRAATPADEVRPLAASRVAVKQVSPPRLSPARPAPGAIIGTSHEQPGADEAPRPQSLQSLQSQQSKQPKQSQLGEEARLLGEALDALKRGRPELALESIGQYRARFPGGALSLEAVLAEVRAHRALRHFDDAFDALGRATSGVPHVELGVLRGEILAERGDCGAANAVLDAVLLERPNGVLEERALATRAACSESLGEPDATAWLERYVTRWPQGAFAARARWLLEDAQARAREAAPQEGDR